MKLIHQITVAIVFLTIVATACGSAQTQAPTARIGFVNSSKILQELPEAIEAQRRLDNHIKRIQDTLEILSNQYQTKLQEYQQKQALMTEEARRAAQQELIQLEQSALSLRERHFGRDGELADLQERLLGPILDRARKAIEEVAKEERLSFVFDQTENVQVLLYGDPKFDYTFKVIDRLKRTKD